MNNWVSRKNGSEKQKKDIRRHRRILHVDVIVTPLSLRTPMLTPVVSRKKKDSPSQS